MPTPSSLIGLPHYQELMPKLEAQLDEFNTLGLLVIEVQGIDPVEETYGPEAYDSLLLNVADLLRKMQGTIIRKDDLLAMNEIGVASFMIFITGERIKNRTGQLDQDDVEKVAQRVERQLFLQMGTLLKEYTRDIPQLAVGYACAVRNPVIRSRRSIHRLVEDAKEISRLRQPISRAHNKERLQKIILTENIQTVFHPVMNLKTGEVVGVEALTRGPKNSVYEMPMTLFAAAREVGLLFELDRLCRQKALTNSKPIHSRYKVFVNTLPNTIHDPEFRGKQLEAFLKGIEKDPGQIIFEINEREAIENFSTFRDSIRYYTDLGMSIAIDDTGTGYSTLEAIVELQPKYLKFDISMVKGISKNPVKQDMLKMLCNLADRLKSIVIAEGIETKEDLDVLVDLGLELGQGFYYARPNNGQAYHS